MVVIWWGLAIFQLFLLASLARLVFHLFQILVSDKILPFVPSNNQLIEEIVNSRELVGAKNVVDLGSGDGKVLLKLGRAYPEINFVGVEYSWLLCQISRLRAWRHPRVRFIHSDMFAVPLEQFDVIYGYWITGLIPKIYDKIVREARPGTKVVCNTFALPDDCNFQKKMIIQDKVKLIIYTI